VTVTTPCREYRGNLHNYGYGYPTIGAQRFKPSGALNGRYCVLLHRWVMEQYLGRQLATDEVVRHLCDNPPCFRFDHLQLGTKDDNSADMVARGRSRRGSRHWNWKGGRSRNYREGRNRRPT
jgi:hypothetical protein